MWQVVSEAVSIWAMPLSIGMFPDIPVEMYHYHWKLLHWPVHTPCCIPQRQRRKVYELAQNMTYIELSNVPTYMDEFVAACFVPHTDKSLFPSIQ